MGKEHDVRERLEQRLQELRAGFEKGEQTLEDLEKQTSMKRESSCFSKEECQINYTPMEQHSTTRGEVRP